MINRVRVVNDEHAILMTEDDYEQFKHAISCIDENPPEWDNDEILDFLTTEINIYYLGKMWGFNDTEVREEICETIEKQRKAS